MTDYYNKYLKYRNKYLQLKKLKGGNIVNLDGIPIIEPSIASSKYGVLFQAAFPTLSRSIVKSLTRGDILQDSFSCKKFLVEKSDNEKRIKSISKFAKTWGIKPETIQTCDNKEDENKCWDKFKNINELFYRKRKDLPDINTESNIITSSTDCYCTIFKTFNESKKLWIKGNNYTIQKLLGLELLPFVSDNIGSIIFRLAPHHYHRIHSPINGKIISIKKLGTEYYSVQPIIVNSHVHDVFTENKRVVLEIEPTIYPGKKIYFVIIGATCVGSIVFSQLNINNYFNLNRNITDVDITDITFTEPIIIKQNEELGWFQYGGSTCVLIYDTQYYDLTKNGNKIAENSQSIIETEITVGLELLTPK